MRNAFTMIELVFVIVIIGILSAVAIPRFAATRDDAFISRGISTLAAVRSAITMERQKRMLRGDFTEITSLTNGTGMFSQFSDDKAGNKNDVLEYPLKAGTETGKWSVDGTGKVYTFHYSSGSCAFTLANNKLTGSCPVFPN